MEGTGEHYQGGHQRNRVDEELTARDDWKGKENDDRIVLAPILRGTPTGITYMRDMKI